MLFRSYAVPAHEVKLCAFMIAGPGIQKPVEYAAQQSHFLGGTDRTEREVPVLAKRPDLVVAKNYGR